MKNEAQADFLLEHGKKWGLMAQEGKVVDATFVDVPKQRNHRDENAKIKAGEVPAGWQEEPHKLSQKDVDARWTKKNEETHFGYKDHVKADAKSKLIEDWKVTEAQRFGFLPRSMGHAAWDSSDIKRYVPPPDQPAL